MNSPIEISNGRDAVKIYRVINRGRSLYQLSYYRAGRRERRTFGDKAAAKREAKAILCQLASNATEADEAISATDIESLVAARTALNGIGLPLHLAVEGFAGAFRLLGPPEDSVAALHRAVAFYVKHHPVGSVRVPLREMVHRYQESRKRLGVSKVWLETIEGKTRAMLKRFPPGNYELPSGREIVDWLDEIYSNPVTKNTTLKTLKAFAAWVVKEKLAGCETISIMERWKVPACDVEIYTPDEMKQILNAAPVLTIPFLALGAFAGLRTAETMRMDWSEIDLERGHLVVSAAKAKTATRRLVPILANLKAWLKPHAKASGPVVLVSQGRIDSLLREKEIPRKRNALRHSYISYRLAAIHDTPRVALECGNSPQMIFKHYRELVAPEEAQQWFNIIPE